MNKKQLQHTNFNINKILNDYKNKMIWLMNNNYTKKRKMVIALDMYERTTKKINKMFPRTNIKDIVSPIDLP